MPTLISLPNLLYFNALCFILLEKLHYLYLTSTTWFTIKIKGWEINIFFYTKYNVHFGKLMLKWCKRVEHINFCYSANIVITLTLCNLNLVSFSRSCEYYLVWHYDYFLIRCMLRYFYIAKFSVNCIDAHAWK